MEGQVLLFTCDFGGTQHPIYIYAAHVVAAMEYPTHRDAATRRTLLQVEGQQYVVCEPVEEVVLKLGWRKAETSSAEILARLCVREAEQVHAAQHPFKTLGDALEDEVSETGVFV